MIVYKKKHLIAIPIPLLCLSHEKVSTPLTPFKWWFVLAIPLSCLFHEKAVYAFTPFKCINLFVSLSLSWEKCQPSLLFLNISIFCFSLSHEKSVYNIYPLFKWVVSCIPNICASRFCSDGGGALDSACSKLFTTSGTYKLLTILINKKKVIKKNNSMCLLTKTKYHNRIQQQWPFVMSLMRKWKISTKI